MTEPADALAVQASRLRVVVIGGGIAGLVAAVECAKVGMRVTVVEASAALGGAIRSADVAGLALDVGAESYATRGGHVRRLIDELALTDAVVEPSSEGAWVAGLPGGTAAPLPTGGVLGIPDNPWRDDVRRVIGWGGAWRAYLDRLRPPLTIGQAQRLGPLVRRRMGQKVLDRLVAPVTTGVYSARPDDIDVELAAPGLNAALTRTGSLSGAVAVLRDGRPTAPGGAVAGLHGGMSRLVAALRTRLVQLDADIRLDTTVASVAARGPAGWSVVTETGAGDLLATATPTTWHADAVIVAVSEPAARRLLAPVVAGLDREGDTGPVVEVITLVVDAPELNGHPRGTGVLTVPGSHAAKALTHATAKWEWLARAAGPGIHVLRVSFGAQHEAPATADLDDAAAARLAVAEASALLGVRLEPAQLRGSHRARYAQSQPAATVGRRAIAESARSAIAAVPHLAAVGAWLSGTGLAQVVPDAIAEADRLRSALLFGRTRSGV